MAGIPRIAAGYPPIADGVPAGHGLWARFKIGLRATGRSILSGFGLSGRNGIFHKTKEEDLFPERFKFLSAFVLALLAAACAPVRECPPYCASDEEILTRAGAVRLTPEQVKYLGSWQEGT